MTAKITGFYPGTTKRIRLELTLEGAAPDIRNDTLTWRIKRHPSDPDASALLTVEADVASEGEAGVARFQADPAATVLAPGSYVTDIEWQRATGENYVVVSQPITIFERVSDAAPPTP